MPIDLSWARHLNPLEWVEDGWDNLTEQPPAAVQTARNQYGSDTTTGTNINETNSGYAQNNSNTSIFGNNQSYGQTQGRAGLEDQSVLSGLMSGLNQAPATSDTPIHDHVNAQRMARTTPAGFQAAVGPITEQYFNAINAADHYGAANQRYGDYQDRTRVAIGRQANQDLRNAYLGNLVNEEDRLLNSAERQRDEIYGDYANQAQILNTAPFTRFNDATQQDASTTNRQQQSLSEQITLNDLLRVINTDTSTQGFQDQSHFTPQVSDLANLIGIVSAVAALAHGPSGSGGAAPTAIPPVGAG